MNDNDVTHEIIGAAIEVHRVLGPGLLESAYEECLSRELELRNLKVERQKPIPVVYKDVKLECGYRIDLLVESRIVVELKSIEAFAPIHRGHHPNLYTPLWMSPWASHQFQRNGTERWDQTIHHLTQCKRKKKFNTENTELRARKALRGLIRSSLRSHRQAVRTQLSLCPFLLCESPCPLPSVASVLNPSLSDCQRKSTESRECRSNFDQPREFARVIVEAWEDQIEIGDADVLGQDFSDNRAKVRRERKVAPLVELMIVQARPPAVNGAAFHVLAHYKHAIRMAVIGSAIAIFLGGSAELAHRHEHDIFHAVAHVLMKRRETLAKVLQQIGKLALHAAFVHVIVPAAAIDEKNFDSDVRLEQLPDLLQTLAKPAGRILRSVFRLIFCRVGFAQKIDGFKRFRAGAVQSVIHRLRVHRFKAAFDNLARSRRLRHHS